MIVREKYLKAIRGFYDSDLIKVITGIRRRIFARSLCNHRISQVRKISNASSLITLFLDFARNFLFSIES